MTDVYPGYGPTKDDIRAELMAAGGAVEYGVEQPSELERRLDERRNNDFYSTKVLAQLYTDNRIDPEILEGWNQLVQCFNMSMPVHTNNRPWVRVQYDTWEIVRNYSDEEMIERIIDDEYHERADLHWREWRKARDNAPPDFKE